MNCEDYCSKNLKKVEVRYYEGETDHYRIILENMEDYNLYENEFFIYDQIGKIWKKGLEEGKSILVNSCGGWTFTENAQYVGPIQIFDGTL